MSGLWTPGGEHEPRPEGEATPSPPPGGEDDAAARAAAEEQLRQLREELADTPVADIVANHVVGLWQLAVLHLDLEGTGSRRLEEARIAIDAVAALVEGLGDELGSHAPALQDALAQLRMAYVQVGERGEPSTD